MQNDITPPAVSVLIPTVRMDEHLDIAVTSALAQTMGAVEVVVVLDGGEVGATPPEWAEDRRVTVLSSSERRGTASTLNTAIGRSSAPLVARLDADDVSEPERLARQVAALDAHPEWDGLGAAATVVDADGAVLGTIDVPTEDTARHLLRRNPFVHSSMLLRRRALDRVGGYDPRCVRMQDYDLWLRLSLEGTLGNLDEPLVQYRVHEGMHSRRTSPFSASARTVLASRRRLARRLGEPAARQLARDGVWTAGQALRNAGLRRPRYLAP